MASQKGEEDIHIPVFALDNPLRKLLDNQNKYSKFVKPGQVVADLGCGPGFFTLPLAEKIGPDGRVYAVDSDLHPIRAVERKARKKKLGNIDTHQTSAADLSFIRDASVDFVLADGLLCTMASREINMAVDEIKRILKPEGIAYLVTGRESMSHVDDQAWEVILTEFILLDRNREPYRGDRWALVAKKTQGLPQTRE